MWSPSTIAIDFGADHDLLEGALRRLIEAVRVEPHHAQEMCQVFTERLRNHMRVEERLLFAVFERLTGLRDAGPTVSLAQTHRQIDGRLDELAKAFADQQDSPALTALMDRLRALIEDQTVQEETVFYPACDQTLLPEDILAALTALHALAPQH